MSRLDGFEIINTVIGITNVSITKSGIAFSKASIEKLDCPEFVVALVDKQGKRIAIKPCAKGDKGARSFFKQGRDVSKGVRWNNFDLQTMIERMMNWNLEECGWKITGDYSDEDNALIFDLTKAEAVKR